MSNQGIWSKHEHTLVRAFNLTRGESRVARECIKGRSNREIAATFGLSPETVNAQLDKVFRKARITKRGELAAILLQRM
jgi:DNA-binding CsgD family transcriptional regulator